MSLRNPLCLFRTIWRSLKCGAWVSGCNYLKDENTPPNVHVATCKTCGHVDFGWTWPKQENTNAN